MENRIDYELLLDFLYASRNNIIMNISMLTKIFYVL